ncbi:MAG: FTR1 family protein [Georgfuchsia sp.]
MFASTVIVFREVLEAALIIGIVAVATRGLPYRARWIYAGIASGIAGSAVVAMLTERISALADGSGQELFNAGVLGLAVLMLAWHNIWMSRHAKELIRDAKQLGAAVTSGDREISALAIVIALAVLREGSETVLFLYGLILGGQQTLGSIALGSCMGLVLGATAGFVLYAGLISIPIRWFFSVTSALILFLAASMASQMARFLVQADKLPSLADPVWDISDVLSDRSPIGLLLHSLVGYDARPSGMQLAFYLASLTLIITGMLLSGRSSSTQSERKYS